MFQDDIDRFELKEDRNKKRKLATTEDSKENTEVHSPKIKKLKVPNGKSKVTHPEEDEDDDDEDDEVKEFDIDDFTEVCQESKSDSDNESPTPSNASEDCDLDSGSDAEIDNSEETDDESE